MKYEEGTTGTFTTRARIERVTPNAAFDEDLVEVQLSGGATVTLYSGHLDETFEADEPEYVDGGVYKDANGGFWQFVDPANYGSTGDPYWYAFGMEQEYRFEYPKRPLRLMD